MPSMKADSKAPKVEPPKIAKTRAENTAGKTDRMLDNLLESVGLERDTGGSA